MKNLNGDKETDTGCNVNQVDGLVRSQEAEGSNPSTPTKRIAARIRSIRSFVTMPWARSSTCSKTLHSFIHRSSNLVGHETLDLGIQVRGLSGEPYKIYLSLVQWKVQNATNVQTEVRFFYEGPVLGYLQQISKISLLMKPNAYPVIQCSFSKCGHCARLKSG